MSGSAGGSGAAALDRSAPPQPGPLRPSGFPRVERRTLSNGIRLLVAEIRDFPVVTLNLIMEAGATRDEPGREGLASITSVLLESGAGERDAARLADDIETLGVSLDTGAGWDTAQAGLTALRSRLEPATEILADVVLRPTFPQDEVERIRAERLAEILQRRTDPRGLATEASGRFVFAPESRFSRPLGGSGAAVEGITRQDVQDFHGRFLGPLGASLVIVGDIGADAAVDLLEARFGGWAGGSPLAEPPQVAPRSEAPQVVIVDRPGAVQSEIRVGHLGLARSPDEFFPVVVMNAILGGMFSSRLNLNLRERNGYTYGASSGFAMRRQPGSFMVSAAVQTDVTAPAVAEIMKELHAIREAPVSDEELRSARNYFAGIFPLRLQTTDGIAGRLAELLVYDLPADYFDTYRARILEVSAEDVHQAALRRIHPERATTIVVGDAAALRPALEALDIGDVTVVDPEALQAMP